MQFDLLTKLKTCSNFRPSNSRVARQREKIKEKIKLFEYMTSSISFIHEIVDFLKRFGGLSFKMQIKP